MESVEDSLKSLCRRVKKALRLLHGSDCAKPAEGGLNESGFKALFQGALAEDGWHAESEFHLGGQYADLVLTRRDAPFDVAVVLDLKYCAAPFLASKAYADAAHDPRQLEALKRLSVLDICKLRMFWSKGYEAVSVKTVLVAAKKQTNAFAEQLLSTGLFPFVLSVAVVGIGPCLVTKIETLGRVRPLLVPSPQTLFPRAHADLARLQARVRAGMATMRSTDGDVDVAQGYKSGVTLTGFKMLFLGALHDSAFFVGSAVNMAAEDRRTRSRREGRSRHRHALTSGSRSSSGSSSRSRSRSRSSSASSSSSSSRSSSGSRHHKRSRRHHKRRSHSTSSSSRSRSRSRSSSRSRSHSRSVSPGGSTTVTRDGVSYTVRNESLGTIHLLLFDDRAHPQHAVVVHFKYIPINDVHEWNAQAQAFERFGDQRFEHDKLRHKRRLYLSEGLRRMATLSREEIERVYVSNPATGGAKVDTVGSIARAYTSLAFRQSQAVLEKFPSLKSCTSVSVIGVGSALLWMQEEVAPTPFSMESVKASLLQTTAPSSAEEMNELARKHPRRKGQSERDYHDMLRDMQRRRENKRREKEAAQGYGNGRRARSLEREHSHSRSHGREPRALVSGNQADVIALLAERYEQRHAHSNGGHRRASSQNRSGKLNKSAYW